MNTVILVYKYRSETMALCIQRIKKELKISDDVKITYAGRLDPMAEGLVLLLTGSMRFFKDQFLHFDKEYRTEFFTGFQTDTYDVLGVPLKTRKTITNFSETELSEKIQLFQPPTLFFQKFPPFSSRRISGKPLFQHVRENTSTNIDIPSHNVSLFSYSKISSTCVARNLFLKDLKKDIINVTGDFRQDVVISSWESLSKLFPEAVCLYTVTMHVSSGFYVRQWVHDFGNYLSTGAVTFSIIRERIGVFTMSMLNGESYHVFDTHDPMIQNLTV